MIDSLGSAVMCELLFNVYMLRSSQWRVWGGGGEGMMHVRGLLAKPLMSSCTYV